MCSPGMTDDNALGRNVLFLWSIEYGMADIADAILSAWMHSLGAATVMGGNCCTRVSFRGDTIAKRDIRKAVVIAVAKVRKNNRPI